MASDPVEDAILRAFPALNFHPASFRFDRGFLVRARRRARPSVLVLDRLSDQLVFVGTRGAADPDTVAERVADEALTELTDLSRAACERLIVAWEDPDRRAFAAAFAVAPDGSVGRLLGSSWSPPETWPDPMIDPSKPGDQVFDEALANLSSLIADRRAAASFDAMVDRSLRLVDLALEVRGGEGQHLSGHPGISASDATWAGWLDRYERSVRDEWRRIVGNSQGRVAVRESTAEGPLSHMRVFLSYARPDAADLARPVDEALRSSGADVWFDQDQPLEKTWLDVGLADKIGECDAYVMCASDEFVERAGYATQEVAWALQQREAGARTKHLLVVARPGTVLPTIVADWPAIELHGQDAEELARLLARHLQAPVGGPPTLPQAPPSPARTPSPPALSPDADLPAMRLRVRHMRRFLEIDPDSVVALAAGTDTRRTLEVRARLRRVGEGLEWAGTLADLDRWPEDSLICDARWRLACARAAAGTRWPLSDDLQDPDDIADDVEYMATRPLPVLGWPIVSGWGDNERRLTLRYHAGLLRVLQELLSRGLFGGLPSVPSSTLDAWEAELPSRRRECHDALIAMRLQGRLSWKGEPPTWDALFRHWWRLLTVSGAVPWDEPVPPAAQLALSSNADDIAAVAAQTTWQAAHYGGSAQQSFKLRGTDVPTSIDVWAAGLSGTEPDRAGENGRRLQLGLLGNADGPAVIQLSWAGFDTPNADLAAGRASAAAPHQLHQALNFSSH